MSGNTVTLGAGGQNPGWVADPTRALGPFGSGGFLLLKYAINNTLPYSTAGGANGLRRISVFLYLKLTGAPGGGTHWILRNTGGPNLNIRLQAGQIQSTHFAAASSVDMVAVGATTLVNGGEYTVCITSGREIGEKHRVYVNGALDAESTITQVIGAYATQPSFQWGGSDGGFSSDTGVPGLIGRMLIYDGELSAAQVVLSHHSYRTAYPGLPPA